MMKTSALLRACLMGVAAAPLMGAGAAIAASADASTSAAAGSPTAVGEIVVTATRKEENLSKVPVSVSAFTAAKMDVQGIKNFSDVAKFTPGVTFDSSSHNISVRGIESTAGSGTTGIYIDDTPVQVRNLGFNANNTLPVVFDLARIEVLRGPQGTLFGAGSEGGTVRYITNQPSLTHFSGFAHGEVAFTAAGGPSYELGLAEGGPLIEDKLGFRISAWGRRDGGWIDRVDYQSRAVTDGNANRVDTYALRAALTWSPVSNLTITPGIDYQKRDQHNYDFYWVSISHPGSYQSGTPDRMADPDRFTLPTLKIQYDIGKVSIISNTAYYDRRERVNGYSGTLYNLSYFQHYLSSDPSVNQYGLTYPTDPQGIPCTNNCGALFPLLTPTGPNVPGLSQYYAQNLITNGQQNFTQEIRVQSNDPTSRLQWTAGFFYAFDRQQSNEEIRDPMLGQISELLWNEDVITAWGVPLLPNGDDYDNNTRAHDKQEALFADATYAITNQLKLNFGFRYAWTKFVFRNTNEGPQDLLGGPPTFDNGGLAEGGKSEQPFTPKVNITYQLTPDDMVYATVSKGYRIGGATPPLPPNCGTGFPTSYNSDTVWNYELGTKDRFFDRKLQVAASGYYIRWFGIQQAFYVPACGIQFTTNAGQAVSDGFDLQSQWQVTRALDLELSAGYNNARFSKTTLDANGDVLNVKGDALDVAPWTVTAAAQYDFTVVGRDAFVRADYTFSSKRTAPIPNEDPATAFFDPGLRPNPPVHQVSLRGGVTLGVWDVELFANNLLNAHPQLDLTHQDAATTLYEATTLRPRTIGISANVKY
jgi:outer membrane receptor protein involved in Fe transport